MNKKHLIPLGVFITLLSIPTQSFAFIPIICDLCTVGVVAGLGISRYFGIDDTVSGVWIGAMIVALISGIIQYCDKKKWNFRFRDPIIAISTIGFSAASLYAAGVIGIHRNTLFHATTIAGDKIVVSSIVWGLVLVGASSLYQWMKRRNGGKAHFPFERVALPIVTLVVASTIFYFMTTK